MAADLSELYEEIIKSVGEDPRREGLVKTGENVLLVSFGSGITWGASILNWSL